MFNQACHHSYLSDEHVRSVIMDFWSHGVVLDVLDQEDYELVFFHRNLCFNIFVDVVC